MNLQSLVPHRDDQLVDREGRGTLTLMKYLEEGARISTYFSVSISASDSPYYAQSGQRILANMSGGDITVIIPTSGGLVVSRKGSSNALTLQGTISGSVNPQILYDGNTADMAFFGNEWRFI